MKKIIILCLILVGFLVAKVDTLALATSATESDGSDYTSLKAEYDKGSVKNQVSGSQMVTFYGVSVCNGSTCTVTYAGGYTNHKDAILNSVSCSGGETKVFYQAGASGKTNLYDETRSQDGYNGSVYWAEEYNVTCTADSSGETLLNPSGNTSGGSSGSSSGGTSGGQYSSSTTTDNPEQGVTTYFIVLGFAAVISYVFMMFVKKFNLFKNI